MSPLLPDEQSQLIEEINSYFPERIKYSHDGYYDRVIVFKAKNYILYDGKKVKIRGSGLKATTKCKALQEFLKKVFDVFVYTPEIADISTNIQTIYNEYVHEIMTMPDISRWAARKTISSTMMESERPNETKVMDALEGSDYTEGDRVYVIYKSDDSLCLVENFDGDYNRKRLLKNLFDTVKVCDTILPVKELFPNYALVKNFSILEAKYESNTGV
jgi:DNA polymerase elongation subunit (family B)